MGYCVHSSGADRVVVGRMLSLNPAVASRQGLSFLYNRWHVRGRVFSAQSDVFLDVYGCLKFFRGVFRQFFVWLKSMLLAWGFVVVVSPDCGRYISVNVDGAKSVE